MDGGKVRSEVGDGLTLALYIADTLTQARALYADGERVQGLLGLREHGFTGMSREEAGQLVETFKGR